MWNERFQARKYLKIVVVGDGGVGKTSLLITYTENRFPLDYVPTIFDNFTTSVIHNEVKLEVTLVDTAGKEEYSRLRSLSYPETNLFLCCFSVASETSFSNIKTKWFPETKHYEPNASFLLVGTKSDLRDSEEKYDFVTREEAINMAKQLGAIGYVECSSLTGQGLKDVFDTGYDFFNPKIKIEKTKGCLLF